MSIIAIAVFVILFADVYFRIKGLGNGLEQSHKRLWQRIDQLKELVDKAEKDLRDFKKQFNLKDLD